MRFCGLDFLFTLAFALDARRQVSTRSPDRGFARDCHVKGFPEFDAFYVHRFR